MIRILTALAVVLGLAHGAAAQDAAKDTAQDAPKVIDMIEGNPDAKVQVIEYASFTCGHCGNFHADQYQKLKENYISTGKIGFTLREVYFDRPGLWASMLARCGGQMRFAGMAELLFEKQSEWIGDGAPAGIAERLRRLGKTAGLAEDTIDACMTDADTAQALVDWFTENADRDDITSTPTLIINGEKYSNMDYEKLAKVLDDKLAE